MASSGTFLFCRLSLMFCMYCSFWLQDWCRSTKFVFQLLGGRNPSHGCHHNIIYVEWHHPIAAFLPEEHGYEVDHSCCCRCTTLVHMLLPVDPNSHLHSNCVQMWTEHFLNLNAMFRSRFWKTAKQNRWFSLAFANLGYWTELNWTFPSLGQDDESIHHFLFDCAMWRQERWQIGSRLGRAAKEADSVMNTLKGFTELMKYVGRTGRFKGAFSELLWHVYCYPNGSCSHC